MNETIKTILNHRSVRSYKPDPIQDNQLDLILQSTQMAPSSINGQQMSIIVIKDQNRKEQLAKLSGNQRFIAEAPVFLVFCSDFYRAHLACEKNGTTLKVTDSLESTLIGSIDVGLAMQNAINAAESLGLGTVPIGSIRNHPEEVSRLLGLPEFVFPMCGLVIGRPNDIPNRKPRLPRKAVIFEEQYDPNIRELIDQYDETMRQYMLDRTKGESDRNWSVNIAQKYGQSSTRDIRPAMAKKGYHNQ